MVEILKKIYLTIFLEAVKLLQTSKFFRKFSDHGSIPTRFWVLARNSNKSDTTRTLEWRHQNFRYVEFSQVYAMLNLVKFMLLQKYNIFINYQFFNFLLKLFNLYQ